MPQVFLRSHQHRHAGVQSGFSDISRWHLPILRFAQERIQHEAVSNLKVTRESAWHLAHRLRKAFAHETHLFTNPIEMGKTYIGGRNRNRHANKRQEGTQGGAGNSSVAPAKNRARKQISTDVVRNTESHTMHNFVAGRARHDATVCTDEPVAYRKLPYRHDSVRRPGSEYVHRQAHVKGIESLRSLLKRGYDGTFHHFSPKHWARYVAEFSACYNIREIDSIAQMAFVVQGMIGKRLKYQYLIANNGLDSGVRA